jgi:hypothetical protein
MRIFATDKKTGEREEITDLYWFEENGVHDFSGKGHHTDYIFEFKAKEQDVILEIGETYRFKQYKDTVFYLQEVAISRDEIRPVLISEELFISRHKLPYEKMYDAIMRRKGIDNTK